MAIKSGLYNEFVKKADSVGEGLVNHPVNPGMPAFKTNQDVPTIDHGCQEKLSCDLHYNMDWYYLARVTDLNCADVVQIDPCFGTQACICSNGYVRISEAMPEQPDDYIGDAQASADAKVQELDNGESGDDGSDDGWVVPVVITCVIVFLVGLGFGIFFFMKRLKARKVASMSKTPIAPLPQTTQMTDVNGTKGPA